MRSCNDLFEVKRRLSICQFSASLGDVNVNAIDSSPTDWSHQHSAGSIGTTGSMEPDAACTFSITVPSMTEKPRKDPLEDKSSCDQQAKVEKPSMTPQEIAKWIDRRSRVAFPTMFAVANLFYWSFIWIWTLSSAGFAHHHWQQNCISLLNGSIDLQDHQLLSIGIVIKHLTTNSVV